MKNSWRYLTVYCLLCLCWLLLWVSEQGQRSFVHAQSESCIVQVYYGDGGTDQGDCRDATTGLCATDGYALEQGLQVCQETVQIFNNGMLMRMYRAPLPIERSLPHSIFAILYWLTPIVVGGLVGWIVGRGRKPRLGGVS